QLNVLVRIVRFQEQQLRDNQVRHLVLDRTDAENHPLLEQARIDVERALATGSLLDHHRHEAEVAFGYMFAIERHEACPYASCVSLFSNSSSVTSLSVTVACSSSASTTWSS